MSGFELETPEDMAPTGGGNFVDKPGVYHMVVTEMRDGIGPKGSAIEGFSVQLDVLAGTVPDQVGRKIDLTFWKPKLTASEKSQAMDRRKNTAFCIAANLVDPNQLGQKLLVDLEKANGQQLVAELSPQTDSEGNPSDKFLQLHYANIYHVDDPEVSGVPKNADALQLIDAANRRKPEFFAFKAKKESKPAAPAPAASSANWDDL